MPLDLFDETSLRIFEESRPRKSNAHAVWFSCHMDHPGKRNQVDVVSLLLEAKSDIEKSGPSMQTPLIAASCTGYKMLVHLLLEQRADKNATDAWGESAYLMACRNQHMEVAELLWGGGPEDTAATPVPNKRHDSGQHLKPSESGVQETVGLSGLHDVPMW